MGRFAAWEHGRGGYTNPQSGKNFEHIRLVMGMSGHCWAGPLKTSHRAIRNQQVAGSIPAGGSSSFQEQQTDTTERRNPGRGRFASAQPVRLHSVEYGWKK